MGVGDAIVPERCLSSFLDILSEFDILAVEAFHRLDRRKSARHVFLRFCKLPLLISERPLHRPPDQGDDSHDERYAGNGYKCQVP